MPGTDGVAGAGHQFFAGAGFALDQQRRIEGRHPLGAGLERANRRGLAEQRIETFGVVVVQRREAFADAVRLIQGQQGAGVGDRRGVQQQGLAVDGDLAQRQAKAVFEQGIEQRRVGEQRRRRFHRPVRGRTGRSTPGWPATPCRRCPAPAPGRSWPRAGHRAASADVAREGCRPRSPPARRAR